MKIALVIFTVSLYFTSVSAQDISNIEISTAQHYFVFLKDKDSLYIKEIDNEEPARLIQTGFLNDFNERFLMQAYY